MSNRGNFSFELFPPKTAEGAAKLRETVAQLGQLKPEFFSVTFGAGGSTQEGTLSTVLDIRGAGFNAAPHLSCIGSTVESIRTIVHAYKDAGIRHMVALRGDLPSGMAMAGEFRHASDLVAFVRAETGDHFHIEVGCYPEVHPQAKSPETDVQAYVTKVKAGASSAITQYFYNSDAYFRFVDEAYQQGADIPVVAGIMPIISSTQLMRFSDACGAEIPRWIRLRLQSYGDDSASIKAFGLEVVTDLCDQLLTAGVPGLHFYTMNQSTAVKQICHNLRLGV